MLLLTADMPKPKRVQGAYIDESETSKVTDFVRLQRPPQYNQEIISQPVQINGKVVVAVITGLMMSMMRCGVMQCMWFSSPQSFN